MDLWGEIGQMGIQNWLAVMAKHKMRRGRTSRSECGMNAATFQHSQFSCSNHLAKVNKRDWKIKQTFHKWFRHFQGYSANASWSLSTFFCPSVNPTCCLGVIILLLMNFTRKASHGQRSSWRQLFSSAERSTSPRIHQQDWELGYAHGWIN